MQILIQHFILIFDEKMIIKIIFFQFEIPNSKNEKASELKNLTLKHEKELIEKN